MQVAAIQPSPLAARSRIAAFMYGTPTPSSADYRRAEQAAAEYWQAYPADPRSAPQGLAARVRVMRLIFGEGSPQHLRASKAHLSALRCQRAALAMPALGSC